MEGGEQGCFYLGTVAEVNVKFFSSYWLNDRVLGKSGTFNELNRRMVGKQQERREIIAQLRGNWAVAASGRNYGATGLLCRGRNIRMYFPPPNFFRDAAAQESVTFPDYWTCHFEGGCDEMRAYELEYSRFG